MNEYELYLQKIAELKNVGLEPQVYGKTALGHPLYYYKLQKRVDYNKRPLRIIIQGGIHAREHITTFLIFRLIEYYNVEIYRELSRQSGCRKTACTHSNYELYFIPSSNVDGLRLCCEGTGFVRDSKIRKKLIRLNLGNEDFSLWKANANGVDLNVNFDARFGTGTKNTLQNGAENYIGAYPNSEPETLALIEFTKKIKPNLTLSYHSKGQEIYYQFFQPSPDLERDKKIAQVIEHTTRYKLVNLSSTSAGGYKDYCIQKLKIPSFTIEVGADSLSHPLKIEHLRQIYKENKNVIKNIIKFIHSNSYFYF